MLHKDEYNQDEYNDYYAQETRGAEILGKKERGSSKKLLIIVVLLALILIGGYFGWKSISGSKNYDTNITKSIENKESKKDTKENNITKSIEDKESKKDIKEDNITKEVTNTITENSKNLKMNPEDIANIVQIVMKKINQKKSNKAKIEKTEEKSIPKSQEQIEDTKLVKSLENSEVDSLLTQLENTDILQEDNNKKAKSKETVDTYNKKVISSEKLANDDLSKLSNDISDIVEEDKNVVEDKNSTEYVKEVDKETKDREKEMRYITVRRGDTLGKIAKRVYGNVMMYKKIYEANPDILKRADRIYVGQRLRVPE